MKQGSKAWFKHKAGRISASKISNLMAGGKGITRKKYLYKLALERLTGEYILEYKSADMDRGNELEAEARQAYQEYILEPVEQVAFEDHPTIEMAGASPDGLVGEDGGVEIKTREYHIQMDFVFGKTKISDKNMKQMQFNMACTGRKWWDYVSYMNVPDEMEGKLPLELVLKVVRVDRCEKQIKAIEQAVRVGNEEVKARVKELKELK